jgi:hypothetical protein
MTTALEFELPSTVVAVDIKTAALVCGTSRDQIERAIASKALRAAYPSARPIIKPEWLEDWVENLPDSRPTPR